MPTISWCSITPRAVWTIHRIFHIFTASVSQRSPSVNRHKDMWPALRPPKDHSSIMAVHINGQRRSASKHQLCTASVRAWTGSCQRTSQFALVTIITSVHTLVRFVFIYTTGTWFPPLWISSLIIWCLIASSASWTWWRAACVCRGWGAFLMRRFIWGEAPSPPRLNCK